ncbi:MAG: hypothetical protein JWQ54_2605 [Mucilaginibacter sp.]|nr:hypothetical protein [Mucilaginibacter sp.]
MAGVFASITTYSQTIKTDSLKSLKPQAGNFSTELNFNPFNGQLKLNNSLNQVKVRYFVNSSVALRLGFNLSKKDSTSNFNNPYGVNSSFYNDSRHTTTYGVNFGFEKHLAGTRRLSPYIGADVYYAKKSSNQTIVNNQSTTTVSGGWLSYSYNGNATIQTVQENGYSRYGVNLISGFDFYIAPHFFFGYEFGFDLSKKNYDNVNVTVTGQGSGNNNNSNSTVSAFNFGTNLMNGIRLGYNF